MVTMGWKITAQKPRLSPNTGAATVTRPVSFSTCHCSSKIFSILQSSCFTPRTLHIEEAKGGSAAADQPCSSSLCSAVLVETFLSFCEHSCALCSFTVSALLLCSHHDRGSVFG